MKTECKLFFTVFLVYLFFISGYGGDYMADAMLQSAMAFVDKGNFIVDEYVKEGCLKSGCDYALYEGHLYSGFPPGATFLAIPFYFVFKPLINLTINTGFISFIPENQARTLLMSVIASIFISMFLSALLTVLLYRFLNNFTKRKYSLFLSFIFAFGTLFFLYATSYFKRILVAFFIFYSFYLMFNMKHNKVSTAKLFFSGLLLGMGIITEYTTIILALFLCLYLLSFLRNRKVLLFGAGLLIPIALLLVYNGFVFDNILFNSYLPENRANIEIREIEGINSFSFPTISGLWHLSFSPWAGIFFYMPIILLSILGFYYGFRNKKYRLDFLFLFLGVLSFYLMLLSLKSTFYPFPCHFGPRTFIAAIPFIFIPLGLAIERIRFIYPLILGVLSFLISLLGNMYYHLTNWVGGCTSKNIIFEYFIPLFAKFGLTNYTLNLIRYKSILNLSVYITNVFMLTALIIMGIVIYLIWRKNQREQKMKYYFAEFRKRTRWYKKKYNTNIQKVIDESILKLPPGSKILDMGCGDGFVSKSYLDDYELYGVDKEEEAINYCTNIYPKGIYSVGDAYNLKFEDNFFDAIIFSQVIEHLYEPEKALKELYRILKPNGIILITTPNYDSFLWAFIEHTYFRFFGGDCKPYKHEVHPSKYKKGMLKQQLGKYFKDVDIRKISIGTTLVAKGIK